jgi:DNA-directed RNA polymerase specialized sigma24 family protein
MNDDYAKMDDNELFRRAFVKNDPRAQSEVFRRYYGFLLRNAHKMRCGAYSEDAVIVCLAAVANCYRQNSAFAMVNAKAYLLTALKNRLCATHRGQKTKGALALGCVGEPIPSTHTPDPNASPEELVECRRELRRAIDKIRKLFKERDCAIFEAHFIEDATIENIGVRFELSPNAVRQIVFRLRRAVSGIPRQSFPAPRSVESHRGQIGRNSSDHSQTKNKPKGKTYRRKSNE